MNKLKVKTKHKTYPIIIGNSTLDYVFKIISERELFRNLFIVVDENVFNLYREYILNAFNQFDSKIYFYTLKPGENSKSIEGLDGIISNLIEKKFGRDTLLISIGGGVTGDLSGFAASIFMRGIQVAHIPTTLLAAVDSAIGGKTGINFSGYKNVLGAFYQPEFVLIDTKFIPGLPFEEINSGIGELIKYAFLTNKKFFNYIFENIDKIYTLEMGILNKIIYESVLFKSSVISKDEFEIGLRKILNLGHTFAHAYESLARYTIKHGEAVNLGIISALFLSYKKNLLTEEKLNHFLKLPLRMMLSSKLIIKDYESVHKYMSGDKKNREGEIKFVLLSDIGKIITDIKAEESEINYAIQMTEKYIA